MAIEACKKPDIDIFGILIGHRTVRKRLVWVCLLISTLSMLLLLTAIELLAT